MADQTTLIGTTGADLRPLGVRGEPLHGTAAQLRRVVRRRLGDATADLLADPQPHEDGSTIDWYAGWTGDVQSLADLESTALVAAASDDFVVLGENNHFRLLADGLCRAVGFEPRVVFEASGVSTLRGLVAVGMGVSIVPPVPAPIAGLVEVPLVDEGAYREIALAWRANSSLSRAAQEFRAYVESQVHSFRSWKGLDTDEGDGSA